MFLGLFVFNLVALISNNIYEGVFGDLGWDEEEGSWPKVRVWMIMQGLAFLW